MNKEPQLFWLASYPKSGNTWTRVFIANLLNENASPVDINDFNTGAIASGRAWVQEAFDFDIDELSHGEVERLRPYAYQWFSQQAEAYEYHKTHDACSYTDEANTQPMFPVEATAGALVIIRNPLDVAVSLAHHNHSTIDETIAKMNNPSSKLCGREDRLYNQLRQWLWTWSQFNHSWMQAPIPKLVVRYEDMKQNPFETFTKIATFLKLPNDADNVARAIEQCKIENLQQQEKQNPFKERSAKAKTFFRKGIVGDWQNKLSAEQVQSLVAAHQPLMEELGYLDHQPQKKTFDHEK